MSSALFVILAIAVFSNSVNAFEDCQHNNQCSPGYCCSMSQQRYSTPTCRKMQALGEPCRPNPNMILNKTFGYPDGSKKKVESGYLGICPCTIGTICSKNSGVCE